MFRLPTLCVLTGLTGSISADEPRRLTEWTHARRPIAHSQQQSGQSGSVGWWAIPGISPHEAGGYIGGARLVHNQAIAKNTLVTGPTTAGTFGWDFVGIHHRAGRIFLRESHDPSQGREFNRLYRTDTAFKVPDVIAAQPLNKAIREAKREHRGEPE